MALVFAILIGALFASAVYLMLRRSIVDLVFGIVMLSHAANLIVFTSGGLERNKPPLVAEMKDQMEYVASDPLSQALVLTAIVISFGLVAFLLALVAQLYWKTGSDDSDGVSPENS